MENKKYYAYVSPVDGSRGDALGDYFDTQQEAQAFIEEKTGFHPYHQHEYGNGEILEWDGNDYV